MTERRPSLLLRAFPSLTDVAFLMPLIFLFYKMDGVKSMLGDGDTGWHLRAGEWMLANGSVPTTDFFSYTKAGEPWFAWEWGWDVIFGWLHQTYGMEAVVLTSLLILCTTFAWLYRLARRMSGNVILAAVFTILAAAASSIHWLARPHIVTLLFVVALLDLLERTRGDGRYRRLLWTIPLTVVWVNLHGGFFVGIVLLGCYAAGSLAEAALAPSREESGSALHATGAYGLAALSCGVASLANPYGWNLHKHIAEYLGEDYHFHYISEFRSLSFQVDAARYFELMLAFGAIAILFSVWRRRFVPALLLAGWAHLALVSARNIPIFAILAAPFCAEAVRFAMEEARKARLAKWFRSTVAEFEDFAGDMARMDAPERFHLVSAGACLLLFALVYAPGATGKLRAEYDARVYPKAAMAAIDDMQSVRIFTDDEWGDYVLYTRYGSRQVFVDGRSDFYGPEFSLRYLDVVNAAPGWRKTLDDYEVDTVLLSPKAALSATLKESADWRLVYDDGLAVVFRRGAPGGGARSGGSVASESSLQLLIPLRGGERSS